MPLTRFVPYSDGIQYDGTNSAEILSLIPEEMNLGAAYIAQEGGGTVRFELVTGPGPGEIYNTELSEGDWLIMLPAHDGTGLPGTFLRTAVRTIESTYLLEDSLATAENLLENEEFISAVVGEVPAPDPQVLHTAVGKAALPALLLNGTTTPVVTLDVAMPDNTYEVKWRAVSGATVLAAIVANGSVTKTTTQVTIPLKAQGLASVAGVLLVEVYKLAAS